MWLIILWPVCILRLHTHSLVAVLCTIGLAIVASVFLIPSASYYGRDVSVYKWPAGNQLPNATSSDTSAITSTFNMQPFVEGPFACQAYYTFEFAGYSSWKEFTTHCCCTKQRDVDIRDPEMLVEMWRCNNGLRKQRYRVLNMTVIRGTAVQANGLDIREFCSSDFAPGASLQFDISSCSDIKYVRNSMVPFERPIFGIILGIGMKPSF